MRYSPSRIARFFNRVRPSRWLGKRPRTSPPPQHAIHPSADALRQVIEETVGTARTAQGSHALVGARIQEVIDQGEALLPLLEFVSLDGVETLSTHWVDLQGNIAGLAGNLGDLSADSDLLAGTTSIMTVSGSAAMLPRFAEYEGNKTFHAAWGNYIHVVSRADLDDEVRSLLVAFGLDRKTPGEKSCLELFEIARLAYGSPVAKNNPSMTSLIPMRECIRATINELLRRRPTQEGAGSEREKIKSIARQLRRPGVSDETINGWANEWHTMNHEDLSGSKKAEISREEWTTRQVAATRYLHSLLTGLDQSLLRGSQG